MRLFFRVFLGISYGLLSADLPMKGDFNDRQNYSEESISLHEIKIEVFGSQGVGKYNKETQNFHSLEFLGEIMVKHFRKCTACIIITVKIQQEIEQKEPIGIRNCTM